MKDITLKIVGKQQFEDVEEDNMEFITEGQLYERGGAYYIVYDETKVSGMEGCKTTIKLADQSVKVRRIGKMGFNTELFFETGKRFNSYYETPYGPMGIEIFTNYVNTDFDPEAGKGTIDIQYHISMDGIAEGRNKLTIDVM